MLGGAASSGTCQIPPAGRRGSECSEDSLAVQPSFQTGCELAALARNWVGTAGVGGETPAWGGKVSDTRGQLCG